MSNIALQEAIALMKDAKRRRDNLETEAQELQERVLQLEANVRQVALWQVYAEYQPEKPLNYNELFFWMIEKNNGNYYFESSSYRINFYSDRKHVHSVGWAERVGWLED